MKCCLQYAWRHCGWTPWNGLPTSWYWKRLRQGLQCIPFLFVSLFVLVFPWCNQFGFNSFSSLSPLGLFALGFWRFYVSLKKMNRKWRPPFTETRPLYQKRVQLNEDAQFMFWLNPESRFITHCKNAFCGNDWLITFCCCCHFRLVFFIWLFPPDISLL